MESLKNHTLGEYGLRKEILGNALKELMSLLQAECGSFFLFDAEHRELVLEEFLNSKNPGIKGLRKRIGEGIAGNVANGLNPVLVKNLDVDSRFQRNGFNHYRSKSFISIPIYNACGLVGLINLTDKATDENFSEKDLELATLVTKYISMALNLHSHSCQIREEKKGLNQQNAALEKYASMGKLAAGVVHEINNPLDGVLRFTNLLISQNNEEIVGKEYLLEIKNGLHRIAGITKSLLEFSHSVNSKSLAETKFVDINHLIDESLDALVKHEAMKFNVEKKYTPTLPKIADFGLQHVFLNLIKNAFEAMPQGGKLEISTQPNNGSIKIAFRDSGHGVPDEVKNRIFEPFFTTKDGKKNTGLGLAMCQEIIAKYEGNIELETLPQKGTTFIISLPKKHLKHD